MSKVKRTPSNDLADELDNLTDPQEEAALNSDSPEEMAAELDAMTSYEPPAPFEKPTKIASLENQKAAAKFVTDMSKKAAQGATMGFGEEALAGLQTGSFSSPEYVTKRQEYRKELEDISKAHPIMAPVAEATGSVLTTGALPFMNASKLARAGKEIGSAIVQGAGEAPETSDIPRYSAMSGLLQTGLEGGGALAGKMLFDDSTKILSKSIGVKKPNLRATEAPEMVTKYAPYGEGEYRAVKELVGEAPTSHAETKAALQSVDRLDKQGFFKQGNKYIDPSTRKFVRTKDSLEGFLKPQTLDDLYNTSVAGIKSLGSVNEQILKNKKVPMIEVQKALNGAIQDISFDPMGQNAQARYELARELEDIVMKDIKYYKSGKDNILPALELEQAKQRLDRALKGPAFEKRAIELGIDKQTMLKVRTAFDKLLDNENVGGTKYKHNNDMISDLMTVRDIINNKLNADYADTGAGLVDMRGWGQWLKEGLSPTSVDIARADISKGLETKPGQLATGIMKRAPVESLVRDRNVGRTPQSIVPFSPMDIVNYRLPRNTQQLVQDKDRVIAKLVQNGVPDEMIDTITQALNGNPDDVSNIAPLLLTQFPTLFQNSKYKVFDGKFIDPNDRAKAADDISKREDLNSIQRAKMINKINKTGEMPEGL